MTAESNEVVTFFVISDSAGETATKLAQATMAQYPSIEFSLFRRTFVTDPETLQRALNDALSEQALVLHTLINQELVDLTNEFCQKNKLYSFDVLTPQLQKLSA